MPSLSVSSVDFFRGRRGPDGAFSSLLPLPCKHPNRAGAGGVGVNTHLQQRSLGVLTGGGLLFFDQFMLDRTPLNQCLPHASLASPGTAASPMINVLPSPATRFTRIPLP